ncbi:MAG: DNA alkylation repair protein [Paracoccaceae bacterium]
MAEKNFSLKDRLFNAESLGRLSVEYADGLSGLDASAFADMALSGVEGRSLMACLDWFADCLEPHLAQDFLTMADQLEAMMPARLDPALRDDDFGHFVHAVPGVFAVRHGLETHRERALDLLYEATQRFSMEFYIRAFLNRWPSETLRRLRNWAEDENYHVRRLVSEGLRPKLPWAQGIDVGHEDAIPFLTQLHADSTRFVTRSVANHLNDISKKHPKVVVECLSQWQGLGLQKESELNWMRRHALRGLVKSGDADAMAHLGYSAEADVNAHLDIETVQAQIGDALKFKVSVTADVDLPVIVDYRIRFHRPSGRPSEKVFKLKVGQLKAGQTVVYEKTHKLKGNATTFALYPGLHALTVQVNGVDRATETFELV